MSCWRTLSFLALAGLSVSIVAAFRKQPEPATAPPPAYPLRPDPTATGMLDRAIAALEPNRVPWLRTTIREQVHASPLAFRVEGTYQNGPDHRLRLDLQVRTDRTVRRLQLGSNGRTFWKVEEDAAGEWKGFTLDWRQASQSSNGAGQDALLRDEVLRSHWFSGPERMLHKLREQAAFTRCEKLRWRDGNVLMLTGARTDAAKDPWGQYRPRQCRLVLDEATLWPLRLEWWGPGLVAGGDVLLMELDLGKPVFNRPITDEMFALPLATGRIEDHTKQWRERVSPAIVADGNAARLP
jgi:hypothetical protein